MKGYPEKKTEYQHQRRYRCQLAVMRDMMSVLLEGVLDQELMKSLAAQYDYRNKETANSKNGHSTKTMHTMLRGHGNGWSPVATGNYEPQLIKKYQNTVTQTWQEKILSHVCKGAMTEEI